MSCIIYEEVDDSYRIEIDGEEIATGIAADDLAEEISDLIEGGDLEPDEQVVFTEWDGSTRLRRAVALLTPAQRRAAGYVLAAQPLRGTTQSDLDEE